MQVAARRPSLQIAISLLLLLNGCGADRSVSQPAREEVLRSEIIRLQAALDAVERGPLPPGLRPLAARHRAALARAEQAVSPALRLYLLRDPSVGVEALRFFTAHPEAAHDLPAFERLWASRQGEHRRLEPVAGTALRRALYQEAASRASILSAASLPYGRTSSPGDGLYYFAEAEGNRQFARFVATIRDDDSEPRPKSSALIAAIERTEQQTLAFFERDPAARTVIPVSARLKEARELVDRGWDDGAMLALLEARLELARRSHAWRGKAQKGAAASEAASGTITQMLRGLASTSDSDAAIIERDLLPLHRTLLIEAPVRSASMAPIRITLVRWPFT